MLLPGPVSTSQAAASAAGGRGFVAGCAATRLVGGTGSGRIAAACQVFLVAGFEIGFAVEVCNVVEAESDAEGAETPVLNVLMSTRFSEVRATNSP